MRSIERSPARRTVHRAGHRIRTESQGRTRLRAAARSVVMAIDEIGDSAPKIGEKSCAQVPASNDSPTHDGQIRHRIVAPPLAKLFAKICPSSWCRPTPNCRWQHISGSAPRTVCGRLISGKHSSSSNTHQAPPDRDSRSPDPATRRLKWTLAHRSSYSRFADTSQLCVRQSAGSSAPCRRNPPGRDVTHLRSDPCPGHFVSGRSVRQQAKSASGIENPSRRPRISRQAQTVAFACRHSLPAGSLP